MAEKLIEGLASDFEPEKYEDDYHRDLMRLIQRKVKAGELNSISDTKPRKAAPRATSNVVDLAALLAQSLEGKRGSHPANQNHSPRKAAPRKTRRKSKTEATTHHRKSA